MDHDREISRELAQRDSAIASGALVRPPRNLSELDSDDKANSAEIDRLEARRSALFSKISDSSLPSREREDLSYSLATCAQALDTAFADRRRLRVARELHRQGIFR